MIINEERLIVFNFLFLDESLDSASAPNTPQITYTTFEEELDKAEEQPLPEVDSDAEEEKRQKKLDKQKKVDKETNVLNK